MNFKIKKLLSCVLAMSIIASMLIVPVQAAAPISKETETVVFDQSFGGLSGASDLSDFTVTGTWNYFEDYMAQTGNYNCNGGVISKKSYDLTEYTSWKFDTKLLSNANGYNLYLGWDETNGNGYRLYQNNSKTTISLFKAGVTDAVATASLSSTFGKVLNGNITYKNGIISVKQNDTEVLSYDKAESSDFNGKFGAQAAAGTTFILFNMKLVKGKGITINHWTYEEDFEGETIDTLKEKGWALKNNAEICDLGDQTYIKYLEAKSGLTTFMPMDSTLSGSFAVNATTKVGYNGYGHYLVINGINGYDYRIYPNKAFNGTDTGNAAIVKCASNTSTGSLTDENILAEAKKPYGMNYYTYIYDVKVIYNDNSVTIDVTITNPTDGKVQLTAKDTTDIITSSKIGINYVNSDQHRLYDFSLSAIVDENEKESVAFEKEIADKIFTSDDNPSSVNKEGFYGGLEKAYNWSFANYTSYTDEKGMRYNNGSTYYYYNATSSDYNIYVDMYRELNNSIVYFNVSSDGTSYYALESNYGNSGKYVRLYKVDSTGTTEYKKIDGFTSSVSAGGYNRSKYKISLDYQDDGSLNIKAYFTANGYDTLILEGSDKSPIAGNNIKLYPGNEGHIKRFTLTVPATETDGEDGALTFNPRFYNADGNVITKIEDGAIFVKSFAIPLEEYSIIAVLYENNIMTDIIPVDVMSVGSKFKLFDVTNADNTEIKLFVFDNSKNLNKVVQTCVLN